MPHLQILHGATEHTPTVDHDWGVPVAKYLKRLRGSASFPVSRFKRPTYAEVDMAVITEELQ
jgi:hypothetical protein